MSYKSLPLAMRYAYEDGDFDTINFFAAIYANPRYIKTVNTRHTRINSNFLKSREPRELEKGPVVDLSKCRSQGNEFFL